jgi:hypothetical protein
MLPDYIIYDELKRERERNRSERPQLEIPRYKPYWPEDEEREDDAHDDDESDIERGETVIPMW